MQLWEHKMALPPDFWLLGEHHELRTDYWSASALQAVRPETTSAELAECTCPEPCQRDHDLD
jgi:hypothetical protein